MNDEFKLQFGGHMEPGDKEHRINFDRKRQVGDEEYEITINSNDRGYFRWGKVCFCAWVDAFHISPFAATAIHWGVSSVFVSA